MGGYIRFLKDYNLIVKQCVDVYSLQTQGHFKGYSYKEVKSNIVCFIIQREV